MRKAYKEYKATGIQWLPQIPRHWDWSFLSQVAAEKKVKKPKNEMFPVMSLSYGHIIKKKNINSGLVPNNYDNYQIISRGDIVLRFTDLQNDHTSLRTGLVKEKGIITSAYTNIKPRINSSFLAYLLHAYDKLKIFYGLGGGVRQSIGFKDVRYLQLPVPPREEQEQIVRFLDWKVSSINKLINIKQQEITELKELKKATISDAVTHGLDKTAPMKDSGISWLGKIPQHWEIQQMKRGFNIFSGATPDSRISGYWNGDITWITPADFSTKDLLITKSGKKITRAGYNSCGTVLVPEGSLIFSKRAPVGKVALTSIPLCTNQGCLSCVPQSGSSSKYFYYLLSVLTSIFENLSNGTTFKELSLETFKNFKLPYPHEKEQYAIGSFLDAHCAEIDRLIAAKQAQITNLHDLKSSLIADAVTGQIDVRDVAIPNYETVQEHADEAPDTIANPLEEAEEV